MMEIKVLGTGCTRCGILEKNVRLAVEELGIEANVVKVEDIVEIMQYSVIATPALVINGKVTVKGSVPTVMELKTLLTLNK